MYYKMDEYRKLAEEILKRYHEDSNGVHCRSYNKEDILDAMCELVEEVEYRTIQRKLQLYYTKEQMTELSKKRHEMALDYLTSFCEYRETGIVYGKNVVETALRIASGIE